MAFCPCEVYGANGRSPVWKRLAVDLAIWKRWFSHWVIPKIRSIADSQPHCDKTKSQGATEGKQLFHQVFSFGYWMLLKPSTWCVSLLKPSSCALLAFLPPWRWLGPDELQPEPRSAATDNRPRWRPRGWDTTALPGEVWVWRTVTSPAIFVQKPPKGHESQTRRGRVYVYI